MAAPWPARPALVLVLLLALLCSHIALCSAADSGKPSKTKAAGGRKALLAAASVDDDEDAPVVKPPAKKKAAAVAAAGKIKKKVGDDAKNQTAKAAGKTKKSESAAAAKGTTTKKASAKAAAGSDGTVAKAAKVPKADKAAAKAKGAADSAAAAKVKSSDSSKPAKVPKSGAAKAGKPAKTAKSDAAAAGAKPKKATNSTVEAGEAKPAKAGKKKAALVVAAEGKLSAKANATAARKEEEEEEDPTVVDEDVAALGTEAAEDGDFISEFRDLPARLQETLMPDLARLSHSSKAYLSAANANIADGVRPILGGRWAAALASAASVALLLLPLCALTALVRRAGAYLPLLHRALLLAQAYLAIYFATLALAAAATGLEPLRFFHAASPAAYAWTQAAQSLGFVGYLVLQMVDLVAVFSGAASPEMEDANGNGDATKALGLAQMVVGLAVGLHYYAAVFHRAASGEAPRANWRVYAVYAACFVVICACARAERRKKAYLGVGAAEEWKKS